MNAESKSVDSAPFSSKASARLHILLWINLLLIVHGSLYPWAFVEPSSWPEAFQHFFDGELWTGMGDVAGNVVLFAPTGALGILLWRKAWPRVAFFALSVLLALVLQIIQVYVPSRDAVLSDMVWNAAGLLLGGVLAWAGLRLTPASMRDSAPVRTAPLALAVLWFAIEWWPYVPTLDWQHVKDALKPLLLAPQWNPRSAGEVAISVVVLGYALREWARGWRWVAAAVVLSALAKLVIVHASLSISHVAGYAVGLAASWVLSRQPARRGATAAALLAFVWFTLDELRPFALAEMPSEFHLMPFDAMLEGTMDSNALALLWDLFWIGAVMVPAIELGAQAVVFGIGLGLWIALLEIAQRWLPNRSADITPALLPLLWALLMPTRARLARQRPPGRVRRV